MRYRIHGFFKEEKHRGYPIVHEMEKYLDNALLIASVINNFTKDYDQSYCYGPSIGIIEDPALVEKNMCEDSV